ncbi:hypothetical protein FRC02_004587, partial [Tulasnella sp. 418]
MLLKIVTPILCLTSVIVSAAPRYPRSSPSCVTYVCPAQDKSGLGHMEGYPNESGKDGLYCT